MYRDLQLSFNTSHRNLKGLALKGQNHASPPRSLHCGADEIGADIALGEVFLVYGVWGVSLLPQQDLDVPAAPENMKNQHVVLFNATSASGATRCAISGQMIAQRSGSCDHAALLRRPIGASIP